jgi:hypothetical protein
MDIYNKMLYQLPNGRVINITVEQYLSMSDSDIQHLLCANAGEAIHNPFTSSALDENSTEKQKEYDFSYHVDDDAEVKEISIEDLTQDDIDLLDSLDI